MKMFLYKSATLLLALLFAAYQVHGDKCEVSCTGEVAGSVVSNPLDCRSYYVCLSDDQPLDVPYACSNDTYFDPESASYDNPCQGSGSCVPSCRQRACLTDCSRYPNTMFVNTYECNLYTFCQLEQDLTCEPPEEYFSFEHQKCTSDSIDCCDPCIPYCYESFTEIADPSDCHRFYLCEETGEINVEVHTSSLCPESGIFNTTSGHCTDEHIDCFQPCIGGSTSTTTEQPTIATT